MNTDTKLIYICLLTNPQRDTLPAFRVSDRMLSTYTGYSKDTIAMCRQQLIDKGRILYEDGYYIFTKQDFVKPSAGRDSSRIYEREYAKLPERVRQIIEVSTTNVSTCTSTCTTTCTSTCVKHNNKHNNNKEVAVDENAVQLSNRLFNWIKKNYPKREHSDSSLGKWAADIEKIHRIDKHSWEQITEIIDWSQQHHFWYQNIKSGNKLRAQFVQLMDRKEDDMKKNNFIKNPQPAKVYGMPSEDKQKQFLESINKDRRVDTNSEAYKLYQEKRKKIGSRNKE